MGNQFKKRIENPPKLRPEEVPRLGEDFAAKRKLQRKK